MNLNDYLIPDFDLTGNLTTEDTLYGLLSDDEEITGYLGLIEDIALSELSDVTLTSPVDGQVLKYEYGTWVNAYETGVGNNDYNLLDNKPSINAVPLTGNKTTAELGLFSGDYNDLTNRPSLATVATTGNYNDLSNRPTIPAAQVNSDWDAVAGVSQIINKPTLAAVATSGDYDDLLNKPTIPNITPIDVTSQITITKNSGNWSVNTYSAYRTGNVVTLYIKFEGNGNTVNAGSNAFQGNVSGIRPVLLSYGTAYISSSATVAGLWSTGGITVRVTGANVTLGTGNTSEFSITYITND